MEPNIKNKFIVLSVCLLLASILFSCGSSQKSSISSKESLTELEQDPLSPEERRKFNYYLLEAARLKEKGEMDGAFDMYSHCLEIDPGSAVTQYELGKLYMYLGQAEKGEELLVAAMNAAPDNYWYKETLAGYYQRKGELAKGVDVIEGMVAQFPSRLEPLMALVDLYNRNKDYEKVIHTLDRLEKLDGKSEQISMEKFRMYLAMDNNEKAFAEIENLAKEYPYEMRYLTMLGDVYMENGKEEEAYATFQQVLEKEPGYAPAMLSMASYYEKTGQDSLYRIQLDSLLLNQKVESNTKVNIMRQLIMRSERGDRDSTKIVGLFNSMLAQEQENADVAMLAAQYLLSKRMDEDAKPVLRQVLDIDPENKPARLQLLSFAISKEDLDEVIALCAPAVEYMPEALEFYYYWGIAHYQKKQHDEALEVFKKGVRQVGPESDKNMASDFYSIMGDLYHLKKMNTEAYAAYDSALVYKPDNIGALNNYAYYLSVERKDLDKAEEMSYRTVKAEPTNNTYLDTYAWILFEKGKYVEARIYIDQAMQNGGDASSVVVEHCGDIYFHNGEPEKALEYWKQAEKLAAETKDDESEARDAKELKRLKKKIANKKYYAE
ncbi:MAG: tetratricopeptide repeat protein [Bacteroides sp.]|nr:tetratricopeptide repeat protein [Bacteroides sp.]